MEENQFLLAKLVDRQPKGGNRVRECEEVLSDSSLLATMRTLASHWKL